MPGDHPRNIVGATAAAEVCNLQKEPPAGKPLFVQPHLSRQAANTCPLARISHAGEVHRGSE